MTVIAILSGSRSERSLEAVVAYRKEAFVLKKLAVGTSLIVVTLGTFVAGSYATSSSAPDLPSWLPAAALPTVAMSSDQQLAISNLLPANDAAQYGVSSDSFANVRLLANTEVGPLYVIPGSSGICLTLASSISCSASPSPRDGVPVALLIPSDAGTAVGGGLIANRGASVSIVARQLELDDERLRPHRFDGSTKSIAVAELQSRPAGERSAARGSRSRTRGFHRGGEEIDASALRLRSYSPHHGPQGLA